MHGVTGFVESAALLVFAAFVLVTICSRIGVPSIVGYILAGTVIGPAGLGLLAENAALTSIGEIGVVLLLFALGLEFSFEKLVRLRKHVFGLGAVQVAVMTITVSLVASLIFDLAPVPAILIGGAVAMSSTAMCLKVLASANALGSAQGRLVIAVLLFQDLESVSKPERGWMAGARCDSRWVLKPIWSTSCGRRAPGGSIAGIICATEAT